MNSAFAGSEQCLERVSPSGAERRDASRNRNAAGVVVGKIQQRINFSDRDPPRPISNLEDLVPGANLPLLEHAEIEPWPSVRNNQSRHLRIVHSNPEPITCDARRCHFKDRAPDFVPVSNAHLVVRQTVDGEILSKLSVLEIVPAEFVLPIPIGLELIDHHGPLFAAVTLEIRLAIAVKIQSAGEDAMGYGALPDRCTDLFAMPLNLLRQTDIDGQELRHRLVWNPRELHSTLSG
jgi:hypothetical protein